MTTRFQRVLWTILPALLLAAIVAPEARSAPFTLGIEPIIGYEYVQKLAPVPHSKNRLIYGARVTAGVLLVSAEGEYTRGEDTETFSDIGLTTKDTADKLKLGLRSGFRLGRLVVLRGRGGVQAKQNTHEETLGGTTTTTVEPITYRPYAGAGLSMELTRKVSASADLVVVFNDINDMTKNEYQTTAGFAVRFP